MADQPDDLLRLDRQICFPLYAASNLMTRLYRPLLAGLDLTYPRYLVMMVLWEASPMPMSELGRRLHLDSGTLTPLLKRLAASGFVTRNREPADERRLTIGLTAKGKALKDQAVHVPVSLLSEFAGDPAQLERLREALAQMVRDLAARVAGLPDKPGLDEPG